MIRDLAIIGGGPAGVAAGVYASRKMLQTFFFVEEFGGQSIVSAGVENWIGTPLVSGQELAKMLKTHLETYAGDVVEIHEGTRVDKIEKTNEHFTLTTNKGEAYEAKTVLIAAGAHRRKLDVKGAEEFDQKGLTYCASCDGPLFTGKDVAVIGGGNAGFETAAQLLAYTKSVTLFDGAATFKADPVTVDKVLKNEKMHAIGNSEILEIIGEKMVTGLRYKDKSSGEEKTINVEGVFVEIGLIPSTGFVEGLLELDEYKRIKVNPKNQQTSITGIWSAGDCTDELYHQNNIAAGDAVKALEDIYNYLHAR